MRLGCLALRLVGFGRSPASTATLALPLALTSRLLTARLRLLPPGLSLLSALPLPLIRLRLRLGLLSALGTSCGLALAVSLLALRRTGPLRLLQLIAGLHIRVRILVAAATTTATPAGTTTASRRPLCGFRLRVTRSFGHRRTLCLSLIRLLGSLRSWLLWLPVARPFALILLGLGSLLFWGLTGCRSRA
jgi:hypothetical protein